MCFRCEAWINYIIISHLPVPFFYFVILLCTLGYISIENCSVIVYRLLLILVYRKKWNCWKEFAWGAFHCHPDTPCHTRHVNKYLPPMHTWKLCLHFSITRQVKDQNKKVANLKHKEQVEKKKSAQMLEEARRREDSLSDSSQQLQVEPQSEGGRARIWSSIFCCLFSLCVLLFLLFLTLLAAFLLDYLSSKKEMTFK